MSVNPGFSGQNIFTATDKLRRLPDDWQTWFADKIEIDGGIDASNCEIIDAGADIYDSRNWHSVKDGEKKSQGIVDAAKV